MNKSAYLIFLVILVLIILTFSCKDSKNTVASIKIDLAAVVGTGDSSVELQGRDVLLSDFLLAKTEATYFQWYNVLKWNNENRKGYIFSNLGLQGSDGMPGSIPSAGESKEPVTTVSWRDVIVWCNALSEMEKLTPCYTFSGSILKDSRSQDCDNAFCDWNANGYRLPTEAEWEYAARGGQIGLKDNSWKYIYSGGNAVGFVAVSEGSYGTADVDSKNANALGIKNMSGNVWEWCWDPEARINKESEKNPKGPVRGVNRIMRGGSWSSYEYNCEVSFRNSDNSGGALNTYGFRLAKSK